MDIEAYKKSLKNPLRARTVTFLIKGDQVLLGMKKRGFGKGYYLGIGGKVEVGETIEQGAIREMQEEINVTPRVLKKMATIHFYFPSIEDESWNQQNIAFITTEWEGEPQESDEIKPEWFNRTEIPLEKMWDDAQYWLPQILEGKKLEAEIIYKDTIKVLSHQIKYE